MTKRRSRGEGSIYYLESKGLWVAKLTLSDGKRKVKYAKNQKTVREWLQTSLNQIRDGSFIKDDSLTVSDFLTNYMETVGKLNLRPKTVEAYSYLIRMHIIPAIGRVNLTKLRPDHLQTLYAQKLESGLSKRTVQFMHSVIHKSLNQALRWGMVNRNVAALVTAPRPKRSTPSVWTPDQVNVFLNTTKDHRYYLVFLLAIYCGFREGEILGIHAENCDLEKGTIQVLHAVQALKGGLVITEPKTKSSRRLVTIPKTALIALRKHIKQINITRGLIITTSTGHPVSPSNLVRQFKTATKDAGLPIIRFHDLRHTSATLLLSAGVHPKVVQERLGHSQISMTMDLYSHVLPSMQEDAAEKINKLLSKP